MDLVLVILLYRYRNQGLLLSELSNRLGSEQKEKSKILRKAAKYGADRWFISGTAILQVVRGRLWLWFMAFNLSCVGTRTIAWLDRMD